MPFSTRLPIPTRVKLPPKIASFLVVESDTNKALTLLFAMWNRVPSSGPDASPDLVILTVAGGEDDLKFVKSERNELFI